MTDLAVAVGTTKAATSINHEPCSSLRSGGWPLSHRNRWPASSESAVSRWICPAGGRATPPRSGTRSTGVRAAPPRSGTPCKGGRAMSPRPGPHRTGPGTRCTGPGTPCSGSGRRCTGPGTPCSGSGTRCTGPGTPCSGSGTWPFCAASRRWLPRRSAAGREGWRSPCAITTTPAPASWGSLTQRVPEGSKPSSSAEVGPHRFLASDCPFPVSTGWTPHGTRPRSVDGSFSRRLPERCGASLAGGERPNRCSLREPSMDVRTCRPKGRCPGSGPVATVVQFSKQGSPANSAPAADACGLLACRGLRSLVAWRTAGGLQRAHAEAPHVLPSQ